MDSIITTVKSCYFCGSEQNLEEHHVFYGTANRRISEVHGLKVYLCAECHRGTYGVHGKYGHEKDPSLKMAAEYAWMKHYNKTEDDFIRIYGKNYL